MPVTDRFDALDFDLLSSVLDRYVAAYTLGTDVLDWYPREAQHVASLAEHTGLSVEFLAGLTAALSPVISVTGNAERVVCAITMALDWGLGWEEAIMRLPCTPATVKTHALTWLRTGRLGPKTGPFSRNLSGDHSGITIDTWMAKAAGCEHKAVTGRNSPMRLACEAAVAAIAETTGHPPSAVQAAIWYGTRRASGRKDTRDSLGPTFKAFMEA